MQFGESGGNHEYPIGGRGHFFSAIVTASITLGDPTKISASGSPPPINLGLQGGRFPPTNHHGKGMADL
jgi:hypothetical protein